MHALFLLIDAVLGLYQWVLILWVVMSWLVAFNVINTYQPFVRTVMHVLDALTRPLLNPIRRVVPVIGGIDISPLVLLLLVYFLRNFLRLDLYPMLAY
ncbi:MAG: YggT family protein [Alphaproteobacteria bacterium]|nr:MAG: YggT family protein [Alphaproteobacteria bacterium]